MEVTWKKFNALGTEIVISAILRPEETKLLDMAEQEIMKFEKDFSRFVVGNELYDFNRLSGDFEVSPTMAWMLRDAKRYYEETGGIFDPTVIGSLEELGYDRNFNDIAEKAGIKNIDPEKIKAEFMKRPKLDELIINGDKVTKPAGLRIDFGGLGKGFIADALCNGIFRDVKDFWISAGGDLAVKGSDKGATGWKIGVQNPHKPESEMLSVKTGGEKIGIATSGVFKRKGTKGGLTWHHLIDPRTGLPVENEVLAVTAISSSAAKADVLAKTVLILGEKEGLDFVDRQPDSACIVFLKDKTMKFSQQANKYL